MKRFLITAILLAWATLARAADSVQVGIELNESTYVPGEAIEAKIVIVNFSGSPILTGEKPGWLALDIRSESEAQFVQKQPLDVTQPFTVPQSKQASFPLNLGDYYAFHQTGQFTVVPVVRWGNRPSDIQAGAPVRFAVSQPATIQEQPFGVKVGSSGEERTRVYTIQRMNAQAYVRVSDRDAGVILGLVKLGKIASFARRVDARLNRLNYLHVLHQSGARDFRHHVISPEGRLVARESYLSDSGRPPFLTHDEANMIHIGGGRPNPQPDDIPLLHAPAPRSASRD